MLCILENGALYKDAYLCIDVCLGDMTRQGSTVHKPLSSTCSTAKISVAMVDNSPPKVMHKLWRDALCFHVSVDGYFWLGFNSAKLSTVATLTALYGGIWQVGLKKADNNIWFWNGW